MYDIKETIAAIATPPGKGGIGIIRISGEDSLKITNEITKSDISLSRPNYAHLDKILDNKKNVVDEAIVIYMKAPKSYTGEDIVELQCHGGSFILSKILDLIIEKGARLAEPGEFTKRAFLNGKIDLSRAEAVMDIINAQSEYAAKASASQLEGKLYKEIKKLTGILLHNTAYIETALDDPERYDLSGYGKELKVELVKIKDDINTLLKTSRQGIIIREGIKTAIIGKPNVGKSSLLNALAGKDRAIVTNIEGTTRDTIEESISIGNFILNLIDTAGIRNTSDELESLGIQRSYRFLDEADLILFVIDSTKDLDKNDFMIIEKVDIDKTIFVYNKIDEKSKVKIETIKKLVNFEEITLIEISAKNDIGINRLKEVIEKKFINEEININNQIIITNKRHEDLLKKALYSIENVIKAIDSGISEDFYTIDLMDAYNSLASITGEVTRDDLANEIFSKFCVGK